LRRFLSSALKQTVADIELIAVDDASPDDCPRVLDEVAARDDRVRVIHRSVNGRAGMARNDGLDRARGHYVFFADADDVVRPDCCERMIQCARAHDADIVACSWAEVAGAGEVLRRKVLPGRVYDLSQPRDRRHCLRTLHFAPWNKLFRRETIGALRFEQFPVNIGEDTLFNVAALCRSRRMVTMSYLGYEYTVHGASATGRGVKGMAYLETIARSQERIRHVLLASDGGPCARRSADWLALKRFTTGGEWIAAHPDTGERQKLWRHWRAYFRDELRPGLAGPGWLIRGFGCALQLENVALAARLMRITLRLLDRMASLNPKPAGKVIPCPAKNT